MQKDLSVKENLDKKLFSLVENTYTLKDFLFGMTKDDLNEIRKTLDIKGISKLKKDKLIIELEKGIFQTLEIIIKEKFGTEEVDYVKYIIDNNGIIEYLDKDIEKVCSLRKLGIAFSGVLQEGKKVVMIPNDLRTPVKDFMIDDVRGTSISKNEKWTNILKGMLYYYGVISLESAYKVTEYLCDEKIDFYDYIMEAASWENDIYKFDKEERIIYLKEVEDYFYILQQQEFRKVGCFPINMDMVNKANEEELCNQEQIFYNVLTNDYNIGDKDAKDTVKICMRKIKNGYSLKDSLEKLFQFVNFKNIEEANAFISSVASVYNNTRMWTLKGYTPDEIRQVEGIVQKVGTIVKGKKVGRNEPCPCGSGKKYKKCCGK